VKSEKTFRFFTFLLSEGKNPQAFHRKLAIFVTQFSEYYIANFY